MPSEEKIEMVKRDLKSMGKANRSLEAAMKAKELHEKRLEVLREEGNVAGIQKTIYILQSLNVEEKIIRAHEIEAKYMDAIGRLDKLEQTIILDGYINGKAYWMIGRDIGYTVDGIKKKIKNIIKKLAEFV